MQLSEIESDAWASLAAAARDPQSGYRYLTLCSVDAELRPQARMVVLRRSDRALRELEFHTDIRSPKWQELSANPQATVLGYSPQTRTQLRFQGRVALFPPETVRAGAAWDALPPWTRSTYAGGPPGDERAFEPRDANGGPEDATASHGRQVFGVVAFRAASLDWFRLQRQDNKRALFLYGEAGALLSDRWINP